MSKYKAKKVEIDGHIFDSKKEAKRYEELREMECAGTISDLRMQVPYVLIPSQKLFGKVIERACTYKADFVYTDKATDKTVVEDVKGYRRGTAYNVFVIKRKLMLERYGIIVKEV